MEHKMPLANNHISVDCVVVGFDGERLRVLLLRRIDYLVVLYIWMKIWMEPLCVC